MEKSNAVIVDLRRLLSMLDVRTKRSNVVDLALERWKRRAAEQRGRAQHHSPSGHDREEIAWQDWKE